MAADGAGVVVFGTGVEGAALRGELPEGAAGGNFSPEFGNACGRRVEEADGDRAVSEGERADESGFEFGKIHDAGWMKLRARRCTEKGFHHKGHKGTRRKDKSTHGNQAAELLRGMRRWASQPRPSVRLRRVRVPPWPSAIWRLRARPMPEPPGLVVKK